MSRYLLGVDVGTSSLKMILLDENGTVAAFTKKTYAITQPKQNWAEIEVETLWEILLTCIQELGKQQSLSDVVGIGLSCMCPGVVALDSEYRPLINPILYADRRSINEGEWIKETVGEERIFQITANTVMAGAISATSILWLKNHHPDIYERTRYFGHINTMLCAMLTGKVAIDPSNASYTALYETTTNGDWSQEICGKIGIDINKLPPIREASEVCGKLIASEIIKLGIPKNTPVVIGGADTACTALACGAIYHGDVFESLGSTNVLTVSVDTPKFCKEYLNRRHVIENKWLYQGAMSNVGLALNWCAEELCKDLKWEAQHADKKIYALLDREAEQSHPGANGVIFLPYLTGERSPIWNPKAKGVFYGITAHTKRSDLVRAVMESCCYGMRQLTEIAEDLIGYKLQKIHLVGGGAKSYTWAQMKADITGKEICVLEQKDSAVIGAAILAGLGVGVFPDIISAINKINNPVEYTFTPSKDIMREDIYQKGYRTYLELYQQLCLCFRRSKRKSNAVKGGVIW